MNDQTWIGLFRGIAIGAMAAAILTIMCSSGCASTPRHKAKRDAVIQKTAVDGTGGAYLEYCEIVQKPRCMTQDEQAAVAGQPWDKQRRIECLRPCDSETATKIQTAIDVVRTAQTALFEVIRDPDATQDEIDAQRQQLARAAKQLLDLLDATGATDALGRALGGQ